MKINVGGIDRIARIAVGLLLLALTLMGTIGRLGLDTASCRWPPA